MNANKLRGKIKERGETLEQFAEQMGISTTALYRKLRGDTEFSREEIQRAGTLLQLTGAELLAIFFAD